MDIVTSPKEMDPQITSWIGASILSCLESAQELWISPQEWDKYSVKILRERAPFMWWQLQLMHFICRYLTLYSFIIKFVFLYTNSFEVIPLDDTDKFLKLAFTELDCYYQP